jgi:hypothetical protein
MLLVVVYGLIQVVLDIAREILFSNKFNIKTLIGAVVH